MLLLDFAKGLALLFVQGRLAGSQIVGDTTCLGPSGSVQSQCQRLYGGAQYHTLPICQSPDVLTIERCIAQPFLASLSIPACDQAVFGAKYPKPYLECISEHSGVAFKNQCNHCVCACNGYSLCTKMGCVAPPMP
ncbi:hypothetical protein IWW38_002006 [Coemansia aciculifera]|uniref:Uncharacterized protein n=1 Tax=Coemansia aciculifera TaxID=417176 RepID=A0ACC1M6N6_9FUNG|nr:hypothetical protein IWW38_002006 [Coemansia aciculifera]